MDKEKLQKVKDQLYKLEDIIDLGVQMPLVAFPQLQKHVETLDKTDIRINYQRKEIETFIEINLVDFEMKDERALSRAFKRLKKQTPDRLQKYRQTPAMTVEEFLKHWEPQKYGY